MAVLPIRPPLVLLVIDTINEFTFEGGRQVLADMSPVAERIGRLKEWVRRARIPTVYVNDNFGRRRSDFRALIAHCLRAASRGRAVTRLLRPDRLDYFVLKPKHSAFYSTALELLLEHFPARTLILTGLLADSCILFTAPGRLHARLRSRRAGGLRRRPHAERPPQGACPDAPGTPGRYEPVNGAGPEDHGPPGGTEGSSSRVATAALTHGVRPSSRKLLSR